MAGDLAVTGSLKVPAACAGDGQSMWHEWMEKRNAPTDARKCLREQLQQQRFYELWHLSNDMWAQASRLPYTSPHKNSRSKGDTEAVIAARGKRNVCR